MKNDRGKVALRANYPYFATSPRQIAIELICCRTALCKCIYLAQLIKANLNFCQREGEERGTQHQILPGRSVWHARAVVRAPYSA